MNDSPDEAEALPPRGRRLVCVIVGNRDIFERMFWIQE